MVFRLMLLGSPPDMVHGHPLRETGSSMTTPTAAGAAPESFRQIVYYISGENTRESFCRGRISAFRSGRAFHRLPQRRFSARGGPVFRRQWSQSPPPSVPLYLLCRKEADALQRPRQKRNFLSLTSVYITMWKTLWKLWKSWAGKVFFGCGLVMRGNGRGHFLSVSVAFCQKTEKTFPSAALAIRRWICYDINEYLWG